ncbi:hypothetical protein, partial [Escherichia coli]
DAAGICSQAQPWHVDVSLTPPYGRCLLRSKAQGELEPLTVALIVSASLLLDGGSAGNTGYAQRRS